MQPGELAETCMRLDSRRLIKISADLQSVEVVMNLMGSDVSMRKELIFNN
jgi:DNA gyrase/topoisomerase IV subunit B